MNRILENQLFRLNNYSLTIGQVVITTAVILINMLLIRVIANIILKRIKVDPKEYGHKVAIIQLVKYVLWTVTFIIALQTLGLDITFLIASSAALLVGLGLGMQIIFKDFMSGIILLVEGTIKVNDIVEIEKQVLKVKKISWRTCEVITRDSNILIIPNHKFTEEYVTNWTHNTSPTRFYVKVGVDYSSDLELVKNCLIQAVSNNKDVMQDDEYKAFVRFTNFGASSLDFEVIFWSDNLFRIENTKSDIRFDIARKFNENNITIPFTQIVIHQSPNL